MTGSNPHSVLSRVTVLPHAGRLWTMVFMVVVAAFYTLTSRAFTIELNLSTETTSFFAAGNPGGPTQGAQALAALQAAKSAFEHLITDELAEIRPEGANTWVRRYSHPSTGVMVAETNVTVAASTVVLFVGARTLPEGILARMTEGQTQARGSGDWQSLVQHRGETGAPVTDFATWGASLAFNPSIPWHFDHTINPPAARVDFYSIALHEIAHVRGFGWALPWRAKNGFESGKVVFRGENALRVNGAGIPITGDHWSEGILSRVFPGGSPQLALMVPNLGFGARRVLTDFDVAALADIGWTLNPQLPLFDSPLTQWRKRHFSPADLGDATKESQVWGLSADPDQDGVVNILEYALNSHPNDGLSVPQIHLVPDATRRGSLMRLRFQRLKNDPDFSVRPERSLDLKSWEAGNALFPPLNTTDTGEGYELAEFAVSGASLDQHCFVRVTVRRASPP